MSVVDHCKASTEVRPRTRVSVSLYLGREGGKRRGGRGEGEAWRGGGVERGRRGEGEEVKHVLDGESSFDF